MKLFIISDNTDAIIGMRLAGIEGVRATDSEAAERAFEKALANEEIGVLLITPGVEALCPARVRELKRGIRPLVVTVPDSDGNAAGDSVTDYIREAIGIQM